MTQSAFVATTRAIAVEVQPFFLEDRSEPADNEFVWAYRVQISNTGPSAVQLLRRKWRITDGRGQTMEVEGPGVVGEQPVLEPGESFQYTSGTPLSTPTGFMGGSYTMLDIASGETFEIAIPTFSLDSPFTERSLH